MLRYNLEWHGHTVLEAFQNWWDAHHTPALRATPCIFAWGIWITRNKVIFQDCRIPLDIVAAQIVSIVQHFKAPVKASRTRGTQEEQIEKNIPWGYFDGASQDQQMTCGGGGVLYKTETHSFQFSAGLGRGTNNYAELMTLRLLMLFALEHGCLSLQVFSDSMLVIEWAKEILQCHVMRLLPILEEVIIFSCN